jgi:O-antigen ligase
VDAELARIGAVLGSAGLATLILAVPRWARLAGLSAWGAGAVLLVPYLAPTGRGHLLFAGSLAAVLAAAVLGVVFHRWPWLAALAALAAAPARIPVDLGSEDANLLLPLYVVVLGAAFALGWRLARGDARARELRRIRWPLAAFLLWTGLSVLWTDDLRQAAISLLAFYLPFGVLAVVLSRLPWSRRWLTALGVQLVAMALVFAAIGLYQWVTRDVFWNPKVIVGNAYAPFYRVNSVFWDPSIYGRFLVVAILAGLALVLGGSRGRIALAGGAAVAAIWVGLVFSFSQSSFAALIVGVIAVAGYAWRRRAVVAVGLAGAVLLSVGFSAPSVRSALIEDAREGLDRATSGRAGLVENGARIALDHPVAGVGLGSFERAYADRTGLRGEEPQKAASHNTPVTVAAETGLPGIALFVWLVAAAFVVPLRRASRSFAGRASLIVALAVIAIAVHSLFYNAFFEDPMLWGALGLSAVVAGWRGERRGAPA